VTARDLNMGRALRDLLSHAKNLLGTKDAAENWVFMPNNELDGITPAEAVQHKTRATGVKTLLEDEAARRRDEARLARNNRSELILIEQNVTIAPQSHTSLDQEVTPLESGAGTHVKDLTKAQDLRA
jgi:hypothetical protein